MNNGSHHPLRISGLILGLGVLVVHSAPAFGGRLVIDPGHGGTYPGSKGALSSDSTCWEKNINLRVALALRDTLTANGYFEGVHFSLTRDNDTTMSPERKAEYAMDRNADEFISIHHNATGDPSTNYSESIYCNALQTSIWLWRDTSGMLAAKVGARINQAFQIGTADCSRSWACLMCGLIVLNRTTMTSVLTEASFLSNQAEHERLCYGYERVGQEAGAIYQGWQSYVDNRGFAVVKTVYNGGADGDVTVDGQPQVSPYIAVWRSMEYHELKAPLQQQFADGVTRPFFRWVTTPFWQNRRDSSFHIVTYFNDVNYTVGNEQEFHLYTAFYSGGPYDVSIGIPSTTVYVGDTVSIPWTVDVGADSTSVVTIQYNRDGAMTSFPELFLGPEFWDAAAGYYWVVNGPATDNARFRIIAHDYAGNWDTAYSGTFTIAESVAKCLDVACPQGYGISDINLNGLCHEVGDVVIFSDYFVYGPPVWNADPSLQACQEAATDVNYDGTILEVADLVYLIRIITGDENPGPRGPAPGKVVSPTNSADLAYRVEDGVLRVTTTSLVDVGGAFLVFRYSGMEPGEAVLSTTASAMRVKSVARGGVLRVLVYPGNKGAKVSAGTNEIFSVPLDGDGQIQLVEVQMADAGGAVLAATVRGGITPNEYSLLQNYPNPFNGGTVITYTLGKAGPVKLEVFDILGGRVASLVNGFQAAGVHQVNWDGKNRSGDPVASGTYFYRLTSNEEVETKKMVLLK